MERISAMLVLTRKTGDEVVIDDEVLVRVLQISGSRIRFLINAPGHIQVWRAELESYAGGSSEGGNLVLCRKHNQMLHIGSTTLKVLELNGSTAKLGFDAPKDTRIMRGELMGGGEAA